MNAIHVVGLLITAALVTVLLLNSIHYWRSGDKPKAYVMSIVSVGTAFVGMFTYHFIAVLVEV